MFAQSIKFENTLIQLKELRKVLYYSGSFIVMDTNRGSNERTSWTRNRSFPTVELLCLLTIELDGFTLSAHWCGYQAGNSTKPQCSEFLFCQFYYISYHWLTHWPHDWNWAPSSPFLESWAGSKPQPSSHMVSLSGHKPHLNWLIIINSDMVKGAHE